MSSANNSNNNNIRRMNELLSKIGRNSKPLVNKLTRKTSKSTEFLDIIENKIKMIKDDIKLTNIQKKTDELKKIFLKFKNFSDKIKNKNDRDLKVRYNNIYRSALYYICPYLSAIILQLSIAVITVAELKKLKKIQKDLLKLFIEYYDVDNDDIQFKNMLGVLDMISSSIEIHPSKNNKNQNLVNEFSQFQMQPRKNNKPN